VNLCFFTFLRASSDIFSLHHKYFGSCSADGLC